MGNFIFYSVSNGNINNKFKFTVADVSNNFSFLLSEEGGVDPQCAPVNPPPKKKNKKKNNVKYQPI